MLSTILWGLFIVIFATVIIYSEKRKQKKRYASPYREQTEQEKEVEKAIELERSRRGGPHIGGGGN